MGIGPWEWDRNGNSHRNGNGNGKEWELIAWVWEGISHSRTSLLRCKICETIHVCQSQEKWSLSLTVNKISAVSKMLAPV